MKKLTKPAWHGMFLSLVLVFGSLNITAAQADDCCYLDFDEKECKELGGCYAKDNVPNFLAKEPHALLKGTYLQRKLDKDGTCDTLKTPEKKVSALVVDKEDGRRGISLKYAEVSVSAVKRACDLKRMRILVDEDGNYLGFPTGKEGEKTSDRIKLKDFNSGAGPFDIKK